jgi:hypothetical protein
MALKFPLDYEPNKKRALVKIVDSIWFQRLTYKPCPWVVFPFKKTFVEDILLGLVENPWSYICATCIS